MKIFLWALTVVAVSLSFTACGDSPEKFVNDVVDSGIKCETHEYDKAKCDELAAEFGESVLEFFKLVVYNNRKKFHSIP